MNARTAILAIALFWPVQSLSQGFAGLGIASDDFAQPAPQPVFNFPQDHGAHPDYRIEWWYLTANLTGPDGTPYGLQWTLFRTALAPGTASGWTSPQMWMGHAAVTTPDAHYVAERLARGGVGQAGVVADPFEAWIDDWALEGPTFDALAMRATGADFAYDMQLRATGPLVFHGDAGYSVKSGEGQASLYYSQPFFEISGTLSLPDGEVAVTGNAWLDREWSSQPLSEGQIGWDWFSLSFDSGDKLMGFQVRGDQQAPFTYASWIEADGTLTAYTSGAFTAQTLKADTVSGHDVPTGWRVQLPDKGVDVEVYALTPNAWMDVSVPYWEGPVTIEGSHTGVGYLEMTGYD